MKATLKFNLPEEQYQFNSAVNGCQWHDLVSDLDEKLRQEIKHQKVDTITPVAGVEPQALENCYIEALQYVRDYCLEEIKDRSLMLHE